MSSRFDIQKTALDGLSVLRRKPIGDKRGYLERMFCNQDLAELFSGKMITQINRTLTESKGTVRGMHFQNPPHAEIKLVTCLKGEVLDVAVDLRQGSPTFLQWHAEILSGENHKTLAIPEGFAHGFQTLTDDCEMLYFHTESHHPESEGALNAKDPRLGITWPLPVAGMSQRDAEHPFIDPSFSGIRP